MNNNKICPTLIKNVSILSNKKQKVIISCNDFNKAKSFLEKNKFNYKPYRFANCFLLSADIDDINMLSELQSVDFLHNNAKVCLANKEANLINLNNLTHNSYLGNNQTICFIDTGIFPHFDFILPKSRIVKFVDLINHNFVPYDDNGHGTFICGVCSGGGIIDKQHMGFAPKSNIIMIKALNSAGLSDTNVILDAMQWIYENHKVYNISVVCMSFGADYLQNNDPLAKGANALWQRGITVVAAAGNSGPDSRSIKSPGSCPSIITVGAYDSNNNQVANFSSRGPTPYGHKPDLIAPAVNLISCSVNFLPYTTMSGTSVATPIIAGICADLKCKYPHIKNYEIKNFLLKNCKKLTGNIDSEGAGFIDFSNF